MEQLLHETVCSIDNKALTFIFLQIIIHSYSFANSTNIVELTTQMSRICIAFSSLYHTVHKESPTGPYTLDRFDWYPTIVFRDARIVDQNKEPIMRFINTLHPFVEKYRDRTGAIDRDLALQMLDTFETEKHILLENANFAGSHLLNLLDIN